MPQSTIVYYNSRSNNTLGGYYGAVRNGNISSKVINTRAQAIIETLFADCYKRLEHAEVMNTHLIRNLGLTTFKFDELWSFVE